MGAYLGNVGPLDVEELYLFLNNTARLDSLCITVYDPATGVTDNVPLLKSTKKDELISYFKREQQFFYYKTVPRKKRGV